MIPVDAKIVALWSSLVILVTVMVSAYRGGIGRELVAGVLIAAAMAWFLWPANYENRD